MVYLTIDGIIGTKRATTSAINIQIGISSQANYTTFLEYGFVKDIVLNSDPPSELFINSITFESYEIRTKTVLSAIFTMSSTAKIASIVIDFQEGNYYDNLFELN